MPRIETNRVADTAEPKPKITVPFSSEARAIINRLQTRNPAGATKVEDEVAIRFAHKGAKGMKRIPISVVKQVIKELNLTVS